MAVALKATPQYVSFTPSGYTSGVRVLSAVYHILENTLYLYDWVHPSGSQLSDQFAGIVLSYARVFGPNSTFAPDMIQQAAKTVSTTMYAAQVTDVLLQSALGQSVAQVTLAQQVKRLYVAPFLALRSILVATVGLLLYTYTQESILVGEVPEANFGMAVLLHITTVVVDRVGELQTGNPREKRLQECFGKKYKVEAMECGLIRSISR